MVGAPAPPGVGDRIANPLPLRRKRRALILGLLGAALLAVGFVLIWALPDLAGGILVAILGVAIFFAGFATATQFLLLPLAEPAYFSIEGGGILLGSGPPGAGSRVMTLDTKATARGEIEKLVPWSGVYRVVRKSKGPSQVYEVVLVDWDKPLNPLARKNAEAHPGVPLPGQMSRIEMTPPQWNAIAGEVPKEKHPT